MEIQESKTFTYKDKLRLMHVLDSQGRVLPQPIKFRIAPRSLDVEINTTSQLIDWCDNDEERQAVLDSKARLEKMRDECQVYEGFFLPITNGTWSEYLTKETKNVELVQAHLVDEKGQPVFSLEEMDALKGRNFVDSATDAILEASQVTTDITKRVQEEKARTLKLLGKLMAEMKMKKNREVAAAQQGISSPGISTSNPGSSQA